MNDPNFPPNLDIRPLHTQQVTEQDDPFNQHTAIEQYGIAGRVWEASRALCQYVTPGSDHDPPCSLLKPGPHRIIELGSGQSLASLRLAGHLTNSDIMVLTDLPNVVPLCRQSIKTWQAATTQSAPRIIAEPLPWGEGIASVRQFMPFTHMILCDLIYFPHLYPPLLHTLLELSESPHQTGEETFGPEIILAYHSRTLALEESFFDAFGQYFKLSRVIGGTDDAKLFVCRRWRVTDRWQLPRVDEVMKGSQEVIKGRSFELIDDIFGAMEWS